MSMKKKVLLQNSMSSSSVEFWEIHIFFTSSRGKFTELLKWNFFVHYVLVYGLMWCDVMWCFNLTLMSKWCVSYHVAGTTIIISYVSNLDWYERYKPLEVLLYLSNHYRIQEISNIFCSVNSNCLAFDSSDWQHFLWRRNSFSYSFIIQIKYLISLHFSFIF